METRLTYLSAYAEGEVLDQDHHAWSALFWPSAQRHTPDSVRHDQRGGEGGQSGLPRTSGWRCQAVYPCNQQQNHPGPWWTLQKVTSAWRTHLEIGHIINGHAIQTCQYSRRTSCLNVGVRISAIKTDIYPSQGRMLALGPFIVTILIVNIDPWNHYHVSVDFFYFNHTSHLYLTLHLYLTDHEGGRDGSMSKGRVRGDI